MATIRWLASFANALKGIRVVFKEERNFRIQVAAATLILILMNIFPLSTIEKCILILLISVVLILELGNSILERLADVFKPRVHTYIKDVKDIGAGMVFLSSVGALLIGVIIFSPHLFILIKKFFSVD
jgi:diacylglycerol kinase